MNNRDTGNPGFTLIEILVAILIFAILITVVFTSFRAIHNSAQALQHDDAYYEMGQAALSRMIRDLQALVVAPALMYKVPGFNEPPDPYRVLGERTSLGGEDFPKLRFTSLEHLSFGGEEVNGISEITYYVQQIDADTVVLKRSDRIWPFEPFEERDRDPVLCENIRSMSLAYWDAEGDTNDVWDSDSDEHDYATPRAVEITLTLGDESDAVSLSTVVTLPVYREEKDASP